MADVSRKRKKGSRTRVWVCARKSDKYQQVRAALVGLGHSGEAWDALAFSIGMLPDAWNHGRALTRLKMLVDAPVFTQATSWARGEWPTFIPAWKAILDSWQSVRKSFQQGERFLDPRIAAGHSNLLRHPMRRHGIEVAPFISTLMVRHDYDSSTLPGRRQIAQRFDHLESMLLAAVMQFHWRSGLTPQDYLDWVPDNRSEFGPFPVASDAACRAVRWLSEADQAALAAQLPLDPDPRKFARLILDWEASVLPTGPAPEDPTEEEKRARSYPTFLANYLYHWIQVLDGRPIEPRTSVGGGPDGHGGGGGTGVDGHIPPDDYLGEVDEADGTASESAPKEQVDEAVASRGIAADDLSVPKLPLQSAQAIAASVSRQKWSAFAAAMAATVTPYDLRYLAAQDADRLASRLISIVEDELAATRKLSIDAQLALIALLVLLLGQPPETVEHTRLIFVVETRDQDDARRAASWSRNDCITLAEALELPIDAPMLLVWPVERASDHPPWLDDDPVRGGPPPMMDVGARRPAALEPIGFLIPAVAPRLAGDKAAESAATSPRQTVRNLLVRAGALGRLLVKAWQRISWAASQVDDSGLSDDDVVLPQATGLALLARGARLFTLADPGSARGGGDVLDDDAPRTVADRLLGFLTSDRGAPCPPGVDAWTIKLLQQHLPAHIEAVTGDKTLAWLVTCQTDAAGQARLYYTQHRLARLAQAWEQGMRAGGLAGLLGRAAERGEAADGRQPLATWPWETDLIRSARLGAPFVAEVHDVRRLLQLLQKRLQAPIPTDRRSALREHHRDLLVLTLIYQGLTTGLRAVRSPVALLRAVEQADRVHILAGLPIADRAMAGLSDKESYYNQRARLVSLPAPLVEQLRVLQAHQVALMVKLDRVEAWNAAPPVVRAMFRLDAEDKPQEVTVAWFEQQLAQLGFEWPANFGRAFLRTHLLARGCQAADLDALLGHRDAGGGPIGLHSTFDFEASMGRLQAAIAELMGEVGLKVMPSALVAGSRPPAAHVPDRQILLAPMHAAGPLGRGRSGRTRQQERLKGLPAFWDAIHQRSTDDDRKQVVLLFRLLRVWAKRGNAYAALLCSEDPIAAAGQRTRDLCTPTEPGSVDAGSGTDPDEAMAPLTSAAAVVCDLVLADGARDLVERIRTLAENGTRARFNLVASWFRLLLRAHKALKQRGIETPANPLVAVIRAPSSPFIEDAVLALPIVDSWRHAIQRWATKALGDARALHAQRVGAADAAEASAAFQRPAPGWPSQKPTSPYTLEGWATALVMSAAVNGMLLDVAQLSMLLRRFCDSTQRDLPLSGPERRAHLDFLVPASGSVDRQTHRWWFDPITELIWLHAPAMPREFRLGDLHPWLRRIALVAFPGSATKPFEPHSFSDLVRCAEVWWLARASRTVVAGQRRHIDASSVLTERWARLAGVKRLVAPAQAAEASQVPSSSATDADTDPAGNPEPKRRKKPAAEQSPLEALALVKFDGDRPRHQRLETDPTDDDAELLAAMHAAHPWLQAVSSELERVASEPSKLVPHSLFEHLPAEHGAVARDLVQFAGWLAAPDGAGFSGPPLIRNFSAAAQAVLMVRGDAVEALPLDAAALVEILDTIDDVPVMAGATLRSLRLVTLRFAQFLGLREQVMALVDPEERDDLDDEDGRLTHADARVLTHEEFADAMSSLAQDVHHDKSVGERARGQLLLTLCFRAGLRPGEVYGLRLMDLVDDFAYVLPYGSHTLKSINARRRVPLGHLMPPDELARVKQYVAARFERGASPEDLLMAVPGQGTNRQGLDRWVHRVLRRVTMDPSVRLYHARHSLASWCDLAMRAVDHPEVLRFFSHLPMTQEFLRRGDAIVQGLFGSTSSALGKTSFGLARLVGHIGPAVTHMHYIHFDDVVRAAVVERELMKVPRSYWMELLGISPSVVSGLMAGDRGLTGLVDRARQKMGWLERTMGLMARPPKGVVETQSPPASALTTNRPVSGWMAFSTIMGISSAIASGARAPEHVARIYGVESKQVDAIMDSLKTWLPRAAQPGKRATDVAALGLVMLSLSAETETLVRGAESWMRQGFNRDPVGLRNELEFLLRAYDRRDRDFHVGNDADLTKLVTLLECLGVAPAFAQLVVRVVGTGDPDLLAPDWTKGPALGAFASCQVRFTGVRSLAKAGSYAKWRGIMPVTAAGESCSNALAVAAAMALCQINPTQST